MAKEDLNEFSFIHRSKGGGAMDVINVFEIVIVQVVSKVYTRIVELHITRHGESCKVLWWC